MVDMGGLYGSDAWKQWLYVCGQLNGEYGGLYIGVRQTSNGYIWGEFKGGYSGLSKEGE